MATYYASPLKADPARIIWTTAESDAGTGMAELAVQLDGLDWIDPDYDAGWREYHPGHWEWQGADIGGHEEAWDHMVDVIDPEGKYTEHTLAEAPAPIRGLVIPERDDRTVEQVIEDAEDAAAEDAYHSIQLERYA